MHEHHSGLCRIAPQSGTAFRLRAGEILRIHDPLGEQVADLYAFKDDDHACSLSSGRTIDYASKIYLSTGDVLYSNDSRQMFRILEDRVGRHDFLLTPCSQEMFEILYQHQGHHPSCFENLYTALAPYGIHPDQIHTTFNVFMNVEVGTDGTVQVKAPKSRAGDFVDLRAEMDLVCALTACSAENSNNGTFKPIDYEIIRRSAGD
ncbi:MAG: urea carboxylase-associated family protein [Comamonadaceae bacterium]|nr:MAG: urea carboxylase-associated family protein [Comamonadaceae bacterium]